MVLSKFPLLFYSFSDNHFSFFLSLLLVSGTYMKNVYLDVLVDKVLALLAHTHTHTHTIQDNFSLTCVVLVGRGRKKKGLPSNRNISGRTGATWVTEKL